MNRQAIVDKTYSDYMSGRRLPGVSDDNYSCALGVRRNGRWLVRRTCAIGNYIPKTEEYSDILNDVGSVSVLCLKFPKVVEKLFGAELNKDGYVSFSDTEFLLDIQNWHDSSVNMARTGPTLEKGAFVRGARDLCMKHKLINPALW